MTFYDVNIVNITTKYASFFTEVILDNVILSSRNKVAQNDIGYYVLYCRFSD